ncbi:DMT family transporter [Comamonas terrigena]|uniref:DMT family transporter n=1 Tax=Comamonas terrigena TaxID=32013 RepID=UPI00289B69D2|nr:DMT family transporter [Comamonas terrigena]
MPLPSLIRLLLLAALWGGSYLSMRIAVPVLGALPTAGGRVLLGALGLGLMVLLQRVPLRFDGKGRAALALGVVNSGIPFAMYALAAQVLPAGYSAILNALTPLMGVLLGTLFFAERITVHKLAGVCVGLAGVAVLVRTGPLPVDAAALWGVAACLVATLCYGLAGYLTQRWIGQRGGLDSRLVALGSQCAAVLLLVPLAAGSLWLHPLPLTSVTPTVAVALLALGLLCTAWAYVLYFRLIADVGALKALTVTFLIPLFGVLWGWLLLGESVGWAHAAGGALIALALWLVLRPAPKPTPAGPAVAATQAAKP